MERPRLTSRHDSAPIRTRPSARGAVIMAAAAATLACGGLRGQHRRRSQQRHDGTGHPNDCRNHRAPTPGALTPRRTDTPITITAANQAFTATLNDSQVVQDFREMPPITLPWFRNAGIGYITELDTPAGRDRPVLHRCPTRRPRLLQPPRQHHHHLCQDQLRSDPHQDGRDHLESGCVREPSWQCGHAHRGPVATADLNGSPVAYGGLGPAALARTRLWHNPSRRTNGGRSPRAPSGRGAPSHGQSGRPPTGGSGSNAHR